MPIAACLLPCCAAFPLRPRSQIKLYFGTQDGGTPPNGFECVFMTENRTAMAGGAGSNSTNGTALDWRPCTSPVSYSNMPDGWYDFMVRLNAT